MKIYIAGKISGLPQAEVERKFATAKEALIAKGYEPISPLDNGCDSICWFDQMAACFQMLKSCDGIYMLSDWINSRGAICEFQAAKHANKTIIFQ